MGSINDVMNMVTLIFVELLSDMQLEMLISRKVMKSKLGGGSW